MKDKISIALLGLGTVGTGVYKVLQLQREEMQAKLGCTVEIKKIMVRNLEKAKAKLAPGDVCLLTDQWQEIATDPEIDIVVEVMGGREPAKTCIEEALRAGKQVVTANKDLIADCGHELMSLAGSLKRDLLFEAAVAGGIPIICPLNQCLQGNHIGQIMGIVNGTTNFILTKMTNDGMDYAEALAIATELGYAEADPTADVEGLDAGRKMAIMASLAFHTKVTFSDVTTEGITRISARDIRYAKEMGCCIKLIGLAREHSGSVEVSVHPMLIPENHPLASVNDSFNAVLVHGDAVGDTMFYGRGAGELPTASAIVGDVFEIVKDIRCGCCGRDSVESYRELPVLEESECAGKFFIRLKVEDRYGVLAAITSIFGCHKVSIEQMLQKRKYENTAEIVIMTERVKAKHLKASIDAIERLEVISSIASVIRVYDDQT